VNAGYLLTCGSIFSRSQVDRFMDVLYKGVTGPVTITDTGKKTKVGCVCYTPPC